MNTLELKKMANEVRKGIVTAVHLSLIHILFFALPY